MSQGYLEKIVLIDLDIDVHDDVCPQSSHAF